MAAAMYHKLPRFVISVLIIININSLIAQQTTDSEKTQNDPAEQLFERLFKQRRVEQLEAVKGLTTVANYEKQHKMVSLVADKVFNVIQTSRVLLENSGFIPGISHFPKDETILDALANILENTALLGDIVLRLPDLSHKVLAAHPDWTAQLHWSLAFSEQTRLLDAQTARLLGLVAQELDPSLRRPDYLNPYARRSQAQRTRTDALPPPKVKGKKKKELKKGPRMTSSTAFRGEL